MKAIVKNKRLDSSELENLTVQKMNMEYPLNFIAKVSSHISNLELRVDPVIIRVNKFDEESAAAFAAAMSQAQNTGQTVVPVVIDSYGGDAYSLLSMIGSIRSSRVPVATVVEGKAMSCGAILFSFGAEGLRFMDPDATLMIHDVSSMAAGKVEEIRANSRETERLNQKVYRTMAKNCGHEDLDYFLKLIHEKGHSDWYLDAEEALKHNVANTLRVPTMVCKIDLEYSLE